MKLLSTSYGRLVLSALEAAPERIAFVQDGASLSYSALADRIGRFVGVLAGYGLGHGDAAAFLAPNKPDVFAAMMACALRGIRYTPLHPLGSFEDHQFILEDAEIDLLFFDQDKFGERGKALAGCSARLKKAVAFGPLQGFEDVSAQADRTQPAVSEVAVSAGDTLAIAYTGGTTGRPKGAILSHCSIVSSVELVCKHWQWPDETRILLSTPISHAAGAMIVPTFLKGGTVFLREGFSAPAILEAVERHRITALFLVPTMIYALLDELGVRDYNTTSLQSVFYGAAPMSPSRLKEGMAHFGPVFMQLYGQVESSVALTALRKEDHLDAEKLLSCGRPLTPENFDILDEAGEAVATGAVGEICVRGPTLMDAYWKRPEATAAAFQSGWLRTGDLARRDEQGFVYIVDRAKDMIVSGGFNVFPREVEDVLSAHEDVSHAAVIGVPHEKWGEAVHALVVTKSDASVTEDDLIRLVREKKGPTHAPKAVEFVEELPLTALGKVDKKTVRERYWTGHDRRVG